MYRFNSSANPTSPQTLVMDDADSVTESNFNAERPTVVIVHGWLNNQNTGLNAVIRDGNFINNLYVSYVIS